MSRTKKVPVEIRLAAMEAEIDEYRGLKQEIKELRKMVESLGAKPAALNQVTLGVTSLDLQVLESYLTAQAKGNGVYTEEFYHAHSILGAILFKAIGSGKSICPKCGASQRRGPVNANNGFRCLKCGAFYMLKLS